MLDQTESLMCVCDYMSLNSDYQFDIKLKTSK